MPQRVVKQLLSLLLIFFFSHWIVSVFSEFLLFCFALVLDFISEVSIKCLVILDCPFMIKIGALTSCLETLKA